jgi:hypothetical protein
VTALLRGLRLLHKIRNYLLAPFIYTAALLLLFQEWLWHASKRWLARLPLLPGITRLEAWIASLSPYAALAIFLLPSLLLLPVKILALVAIAHGHPSLGLLIVLSAKVLGTTLVARLYTLTRRALTSLAWFVRWRDALLRFKDRMISQLRATAAWQQIVTGMAGLQQRWRQWMDVLRLRWQGGGRRNRLLRLIKKYAARQRDRE